jgi:hypothetical protein
MRAAEQRRGVRYAEKDSRNEFPETSGYSKLEHDNLSRVYQSKIMLIPRSKRHPNFAGKQQGFRLQDCDQ